MGIIGKRVTMPLLSTLAALVIIVNSAEEEMDRQYRRQIQSRSLNVDTPEYDQPWRAVGMEPMMQQTTQRGWHESSVEDPSNYRRPLRKRKRRPIAASSQEDHMEPERRQIFREPPSPYYEDKRQDSQEFIRRRRKRPELRVQWPPGPLDEIDRPVRRRNQKKKQMNANPRLSDLNPYIEDTQPERIENADITNNGPANETPIEEKDHSLDDYGSAEQKEQEPNLKPVEITEDELSEQSDPVVPLDSDNEPHVFQLKDDKSLSEFSSEMTGGIPSAFSVNEENNLTQEKTTDEDENKLKELEKAKSKGALDPLTLKEILKRSKGQSLSETLQQHNLTLADLLRGRKEALSVFTSAEPPKTIISYKEDIEINEPHNDVEIKNSSVSEVTTLSSITTTLQQEETETSIPVQSSESTTNLPKIQLRRRTPAGRRKLRLKPSLTQSNSGYKAPLSRDLVALHSKRYLNSHNITNLAKFKEWQKNLALRRNLTLKSNDIITTTTHKPEETTTVFDIDDNPTTTSISLDYMEINNITLAKPNTSDKTTTTVIESESITTELPDMITERPLTTPLVKAITNNPNLRRQRYNNRLKKKRLKNSTTESIDDDTMKEVFGMENLVSASEFIEKTHTPSTRDRSTKLDHVSLDDIVLTTSSYHENRRKHNRFSTTQKNIVTPSTTEESAKIEIEEILNDTRTSARLSKILMERNMTINELVEHRERGSSHVHLADIFHNASREPNPPEPFLSKSLIEPISKETYPLRALLDANLHDTKTTIEPMVEPTQYVEIPVVMDFGNNVNENGENMGVLSLFNKFTMSDKGNSAIRKDSEGKPYVTTVIDEKISKINDTKRESRVMNENKDNQDTLTWNELITLIKNNNDNETEDVLGSMTKESTPIESNNKKTTSEEDIDGDGLIVLEDLQHLRDFDNNVASVSDEKLEMSIFERTEPPVRTTSILDKIPGNTKSVIVAIASIVGISLVLFLLTYAVVKWRQQRKQYNKKDNYLEERIPTPVFETRKGKTNCSSRSISPMLSSNIYTLNTSDSNNGKDSPDYMWDSLRKPFQ